MDDENLAAQREAFEREKYGRAPHPEMAARSHVYVKDSIEPAYGNFDRPISGLLY